MNLNLFVNMIQCYFIIMGTDVNGKSSKEIFYRRLCQNQQCVNDSNTGILCSGNSGEH